MRLVHESCRGVEANKGKRRRRSQMAAKTQAVPGRCSGLAPFSVQDEARGRVRPLQSCGLGASERHDDDQTRAIETRAMGGQYLVLRAQRSTSFRRQGRTCLMESRDLHKVGRQARQGPPHLGTRCTSYLASLVLHCARSYGTLQVGTIVLDGGRRGRPPGGCQRRAEDSSDTGREAHAQNALEAR